MSIHIVTWAGSIARPREVPYQGAPIVFGVQTFARQKNDYHLGPFFSDGSAVRITRDQLELLARVHLDFGLMDYVVLEDGFSFVEIAHWSAADVKRALEARQPEVARGSFFSAHERELWGSPADYCERLRRSASARMRPAPKAGGLVIRDEWDGSRAEYAYTYRVAPDASA